MAKIRVDSWLNNILLILSKKYPCLFVSIRGSFVPTGLFGFLDGFWVVGGGVGVPGFVVLGEGGGAEAAQQDGAAADDNIRQVESFLHDVGYELIEKCVHR